MTSHVFVDESKQRDYYLAAATIPSTELALCRQVIRALILPGQRRLHFKNEGLPRRRKILDAIRDLRPTIVIYDARQHARQPAARHACLVALIPDVLSIGAERLVFETDEAALRADRATLFAEIRRSGTPPGLRYYHQRAYEECLLAIPDAVAWCWAQGGRWRGEVRQLVTRVQRV